MPVILFAVSQFQHPSAVVEHLWPLPLSVPTNSEVNNLIIQLVIRHTSLLYNLHIPPLAVVLVPADFQFP